MLEGWASMWSQGKSWGSWSPQRTLGAIGTNWRSLATGSHWGAGHKGVVGSEGAGWGWGVGLKGERHLVQH